MITVAEMNGVTSLINHYQQYGIDEVRLKDNTAKGGTFLLTLIFCNDSSLYDEEGNKVNRLTYKYDKQLNNFRLRFMSITDRKTQSEWVKKVWWK